MSRTGRRRGFTLIELMVTIAVAATLMMVAAPSFVAFQRNSELTAAVNGLLAAAGTARSEAMKRNLPALVAPLGSGWASGWRVFVDLDRNGAFSAGDVTVGTQAALPAYITVTYADTTGGGGTLLRFDGSGYARNTDNSLATANLAFTRTDLSGTELLQQTRYFILALTGRARVCRPASASDSSCNASSTS